MRITKIKTKVLNLTLKKPLVLAFSTVESAETIIVKIETDNGLYGYGEASPSSLVTGETKETVLAILKKLESSLIGENPLEIGKIHKKMNSIIGFNSSAKASIDIALYDIYAKALNVPLYVALGGYNQEVESDRTISIGAIDEVVSDVKNVMAEGFTKVKLKAGLDYKHDIQSMIAVRKECGDDLIIRMDANQGWNCSDAIIAINEMSKYNLDAIEQPVKYWDIESLKKVREKINVPLMADESIHNEFDAIKLVKSDAVDVLNIKLMKSKGIYGAIKINTIAEASGLETMVGCMLESPIGISAGVHFATANKNVTRIDLDSLFFTNNSPEITGGVQFDGGKAKIPQKAGLGIEVDF